MATPTATERWTITDLDRFPDTEYRYEIIDGALHVSKQPHWHHQFVSGQVFAFLQAWSASTGSGIALPAPGIIFADDEAVAPDVVWISQTRFTTSAGADGKLHAAPELVVEVLSPGSANAERDRTDKLALYDRRGVLEYWIVDWRQRQVEIYRRTQDGLPLIDVLNSQDTLTSPLLPGFTVLVDQLFAHP